MALTDKQTRISQLIAYTYSLHGLLVINFRLKFQTEYLAMRDSDSQNFCFKQTIAITAELLLFNINVIILL